MRRGGLVLFIRLSVLLLIGLAGQNASAQAPTDQDTKDQARSHFEQGLAYFDRENWGAALAEFLESRRLFPTRVATKNAATCLRKEQRFDEALEMFEAFLQEFPDAPPADKLFAQREVDDLKLHVGTIDIRGAEAGATIVIDGRDRGAAPLAAPVRVSAGTHVVKIYKNGFGQFEKRVDVAERSSSVVQARLEALTAGGRLRVTEGNGKALDVVVDNVVVGKSPWEGAVAPGDHVVLLRGAGADANLGTQPAAAPVRINQLTPITLVAEELAGAARIVPTPAGATVAIDGVTVGRGLWDGRLRVGSHRVEIAAEGFLPTTRTVQLETSKRAVIDIALERDLGSPLWAAKNPPRIFFEVDGAFALAPVLGGDVLGSCSGACSSGLPLGFRAVLHGGYELSSGIGFALDVGYVRVSTSAKDRAAALKPVGITDNQGKVTDDLGFGGLSVGGSAAYHTRGSSWPLMARLGVGVVLGSASDDRAGRFRNTKNVDYDVSLRQSDSATYLSVTPELRIGHRFGEHFEVNVGTEVMVLFALKKPVWPTGTQTLTAPPNTDRGDGLATFPQQSLTGATILAITPGLGARYDF